MKMLVFLMLVTRATVSLAQANLNDVAADLAVPATTAEAPAAGQRVRATTPGWEATEVHHALYLPTDWQPGKKFPVIVEYAGNGGYANKLGDTSDGSVEGCMLGYGLSAGHGYIWVCMPYVEINAGQKRNASKWWGDVAETKKYCQATVQEICTRFNGDAGRVVLMGFSRGAIACNYLGLHDDEIAGLWCGFLCHSHYEGEFKHPAADQTSWPERLKRLGNRPQFISQEMSTQATQAVIAGSGIKGNFTFITLPYPNHSARWALCDLPIRRAAREWLQKVTEGGVDPHKDTSR
ncbi:MAG: hypothetical protein JWO94_3140 [Verrucomicrobiaceae bacterium]|nr:hypothetical protein [Verrucomicrobiaceae bacterium]